MNSKLVIEVGLPRSGKSTWAMKQNVPVVNPDSIRLALHGQAYAPEAEEHVWAIARTMVKALFIAGHPVVILDATNGSAGRREEWISDLWERHFVVFCTTPEDCNQRALDTDRPELIPVIDRMLRHWQDVNVKEELASDETLTTSPAAMARDIERWRTA